MQPIENHTPDTCKPERKLCNRVCGILLIYMLLMNLVVVCAVWIGAGIELIRLGKTGYGMEQALRELASHADQLLQNGTGYLVVSGMCLVIILLWKGPAFFRSVFRPAQTMSSSVFLQLLCIFMAAQVLSSLFSTALEALFNLWGLSITEALVQASGMTNSPTMLLYISLVAPVVEELLFRGAVLRSFQPFGKRFAIVFSALLFGLFHGNLVQIPFAFLVGLVLGYVAVEYSISWAILLHFINNGIFSTLLSQAPTFQTLLLLCLFIAGIIIFAAHSNAIRTYHRSLHPMPIPAVRGFWSAPCTIILLLLCLFSAVLSIQVQTGF